MNAAFEGTVAFPIEDIQGQRHDIAAVVDTAYARFLTLPPDQIRALGLIWATTVQGVPGDGTVASFDAYYATLIWDGRPRAIEVDASDVPPLVGMGMMAGYQLRIRVVVGGPVEIEELP